MAPPPDGGANDLSACGAGNPACQCSTDESCAAPTPRCAASGTCVACLPQNDNCSFNHWCDPSTDTCKTGCKSNAECAQLAGADGGTGPGKLCDPTRHTCVECIGNNDCPTGKLCSQAGACVPGCDIAAGKFCPGTLSCCNKLCIDTTNDPFNCHGCGLVCSGGNTQCCNSQCSNPLTDAGNCGGCGMACSTANAMATSCGGAMCSWTCNSGFAHCAVGNTGCETNLTSANKKLCGTACIPASSCCTSTDCMSPPTPGACYNNPGSCSGVGGTCSYGLKTGSVVCNGTTCCNAINGTCNGNCTLSCTSGYAHCDGDPSNGCEVNLAAAGKRLCGAACIPIATCCTSPECTMPPNPTACYPSTGSCPAPGGTCQYTPNSGSQICGNTCCNAINGTCNINCTLNCAAPYRDCDGNPANGCETNTNTDPTHCGSCVNVCNLPFTTSNGCVGGSCTVVTCAAGHYDCNGIASDGCEAVGPATGPGCCTGTTPTASGTAMIQHDNGQGGDYYDCYPIGTPGTPSSYNPTMAMDAANSFAGQPGNATTGWTCGSGTNAVSSVCKSVDPAGSTGTCTCWAYASGGAAVANAIVGHTFQNPGNGCQCLGADRTWN